MSQVQHIASIKAAFLDGQFELPESLLRELYGREHGEESVFPGWVESEVPYVPPMSAREQAESIFSDNMANDGESVSVESLQRWLEELDAANGKCVRCQCGKSIPAQGFGMCDTCMTFDDVLNVHSESYQDGY